MRHLFASAALALPVGFANANAGSKLYISSASVSVGINKTALEALTWTEIKGIGSHGEAGVSTNILNYDTWDTTVIQKAKGMSDAGSPQLELARDQADAGQDALRAAALTNVNWAFKMERNDKPNSNVGSKPTIIYNVGLVAGPTRPFGRNEDFDLEVFTLALQQLEIVVDPVTA